MNIPVGRGGTPSYINVVKGTWSKSRGGEGYSRRQGKSGDNPVLGAQWKAHLKGRFLLKAPTNPKFEIPKNRLEQSRSYMKDHMLIFKFMGMFPK